MVRILGLLCILAGLTLNVYFFTAIAPDGDLEGGTVRGAIWAFDVVMVLAGIALLRFNPRIPRRPDIRNHSLHDGRTRLSALR